jgi:cation transport ATPase
MLDQIVQVVRERQINRTLIEQDAGLFTTYVASVITLIAITTWVGMVLGFPNDALNH